MEAFFGFLSIFSLCLAAFAIVRQHGKYSQEIKSQEISHARWIRDHDSKEKLSQDILDKFESRVSVLENESKTLARSVTEIGGRKIRA